MCAISCGFSFLLSLVACQLEIAPTRLRLVHSCTQSHSANCRLVRYTPDQNHREDDCGFNGQREQRGPQKQNQTLRHFNKYPKSPSWRRMNRLPHLFIQTMSALFKQMFYTHFCVQNGCKTQNGGLGWGFRGTWPYSAVIIRAVMLCWSYWPWDMQRACKENSLSTNHDQKTRS